MIKLYFCLLLLICCPDIIGQSAYVPKRTITYDLIDRYRVIHGTQNPLITTSSNYYRSDIMPFALDLYQDSSINELTRQNLAYLIEDNLEYLGKLDGNTAVKEYSDTSKTFYGLDEKEATPIYEPEDREPLFKYFYKSKANFLEYNEENFLLRINPILNIDGGFSQDAETSIFQNTRGVEIRGLLDKRIYFYTSLLENQRAFLNYQNRTINKERAIPGYGLYKNFQSRVAKQLTGFDYFNAQAYVGLPVSKHVQVEFGHGNHFWGDGIRSLLLSDHAHNYFYLKLNTRIGKFQLQNIFAEVASISSQQIQGDQLIPKKYFASHLFTFRPTQTFSLSLFETVVFSRENNFEFQYLNPIILYRTVEQFIGSPDNVMLGASGRWDIKKQFSLYGQVIIDELKVGEVFGGNGWWGNKYGLQAGLKYFNAFEIDHLDLQFEYNRVRPFTYTHRTAIEAFPERSIANYSHFSQPLAHPLGANFSELLLRFRYQIRHNWIIDGRSYIAKQGVDTNNEVFGSNIFTLNSLRDRDFDFGLGDGAKEDVFGLHLRSSYMFAHNYWIDVSAVFRNFESELENPIDTRAVQFGIRANITHLPFDY